MKPYFADGTVTLYGPGDCRDLLADVAPQSVDAIVTDPPYEYGFMGKDWDATGAAFDVTTWKRCLDVLKPGGWLLAFGGTRTHHRMVCAIEDAGFEIRDSIHWIYGSGWPKSLNVGRSIDMYVCVLPGRHFANAIPKNPRPGDHVCPLSGQGDPWRGHGTAQKPAHEPIVVARKPIDGTVAGNVLTHGTGALNIDACRTGDGADRSSGGLTGKRVNADEGYMGAWSDAERGRERPTGGRWPTNVVLTHQPLLDDDGNIIGDACADGCVPGCPVADMDAQSGILKSGVFAPHHADHGKAAGTYGAMKGRTPGQTFGGDSGGASRFFPVFRYEAKAPASERPQLARKAMRLRADLTDEQRAYVLDELMKAGVNVA